MTEKNTANIGFEKKIWDDAVTTVMSLCEMWADNLMSV